jgi:hypothetical protein
MYKPINDESAAALLRRITVGTQPTAAVDAVQLCRVANALHEISNPQGPTGEAYENLQRLLYAHARGLLARALAADTEINRLHALLNDAAERIQPCPVPDAFNGCDSCGHGSWPCRDTVLAWRLRGLDPETEQDRIMTAVRAEIITRLEAEESPHG